MRVWIALWAVATISFPCLAGDTFGYRILSDDRFAVRRVVAVELAQRAPVDRLSQIADAIKAKDNKAYERTVINFYLPSMSLGDGSWATVSYTPERFTTVNGLTREEELAVTEKIRQDARDRIGTWLASSAAIAGEVTIFRKDGRKFVEWSLRNGLKSTDEVVESRTWRGKRFDVIGGSHTHFLINSNNDLEIRDAKGLVATGAFVHLDIAARKRAALMRKRAKSARRVEAHVTVRPADDLQGVNGNDSPHAHRGNAQYQVYRTPPTARAQAQTNGNANADAPGLAKPVPSGPSRPRKARKAKRAQPTAADITMANILR